MIPFNPLLIFQYIKQYWQLAVIATLTLIIMFFVVKTYSLKLELSNKEQTLIHLTDENSRIKNVNESNQKVIASLGSEIMRLENVINDIHTIDYKENQKLKQLISSLKEKCKPTIDIIKDCNCSNIKILKPKENDEIFKSISTIGE